MRSPAASREKRATMRSLAISSAFVAALIAVAAHAASARAGERIVIFASEKLGNDWIETHFNTIPEGKPSYNQCEISLSEALGRIGFTGTGGEFTGSQRKRARKLRTVFRRYKDMSTMANDTAVKASGIVDGEAHAVVLCTAEVGNKRRWHGRGGANSCTEVRCKAVSTLDLSRVATHSIKRCAEGLETAGAEVEAIGAACSEAGAGLGEKIIGLKEKGT